MPTGNSIPIPPVRKAQPSKPETHERGFRGTWAHKSLHDKVEAGELSPTAAWLAMVIDSLHGKAGCFATNEYLGTKIHRTADHVRDLLRRLEKAGVLCSRWEGKTRYLWIDWDGESSQKRRKTYRAKARTTETGEKSPVETGEKSPVSNLISIKALDRGAAAAPPPCTPPPLNGHSGNGEHPRVESRRFTISPPVEDQATKDARSFRTALHEGGIHVADTVKGCSDNLRKLYIRDGLARKIFLWYGGLCRKGRSELRRLGLPTITSGVQFCRRYDDWIRDKYEKYMGPLTESRVESVEDLGNGRTRTRFRIQEEGRPANVEDLGNGRTRTRFKVDA